ncbi:MAG: pyridoxamine 5'-phosphate oxidase [Phycisphaerales bacterium]|nr:pyridoxamine 5'-phosphate oxidase [Phycisphaerales bacterium]
MRLDFDRPPADPVPVMQAWLEEAISRKDVPNPNAMTLCTVRPDGAPAARIVLLKDLSHEGAVFFTNRASAKGRELAGCPRAALVLHWDHLGRQVRIEGSVSQTSDAVSDAYFASRHPVSRLGARASEQSRPCSNRAQLMAALEAARAQCEDPDDPPRPAHWGGYCVALDAVELWQEGEHRLHDRLRYEHTPKGWAVQRLFP